MNRALVALGVAALFAVPWMVANPFMLHLAIMVLMWTALGASWNLLGGALSALLALPIGYICFRLRGPYFALATLAVAEIVRLVATNWESLTAGPVGLLITTLPEMAIAGHSVNWEDKAPFYLIIALIVVAVTGATWAITRMRFGAYLLAIRDDPDSAEAIGIDTVRTNVAALGLSAFFAGMTGGFYAVYFRYIDPDAVFSIALSVEMVFIAVVGGLATVGGPLIGAVFLVTLGEVFRERFLLGHLIFYGLFMMLAIRYLPEGIWGRLRLAFAWRH